MRIEVEDHFFVSYCDIVDSSLFRDAGFNFRNGRWVTPFAVVAHKLYSAMDAAARSLLQSKLEKEKYLYESSFSLLPSKGFSVPAPKGLAYRAYQIAGVEQISERLKYFKACYLCDEMGVGKTIQVIGYLNLAMPPRVCVVCPASLRAVWREELAKWLTYAPETAIYSYDSLVKNRGVIKEKAWDVLILDESHYLKNPKALRTKEVFGHRQTGVAPIPTGFIIAMSGTPIPNRPIEIFPVLKRLLPDGFFNEFYFAKKFCAAKKNNFGWDFSGSSNCDLLQKLLRSSVMLRREKASVLPELPQKIRQIVKIDLDTKTKKLLQSEKDFWAVFKKKSGITKKPEDLTDTELEFAEAVMVLLTPANFGFTAMSSVRAENAVIKLPYAIAHIQDMLDSGVEKVVVFGHHKVMLKGLHSHFEKDSVLVDGETSEAARVFARKSFQEGAVKIFFGNIQAAGVGLTLTAAKVCLFVEEDWVPGNITQAEDRIHRIGAVGDSVLIQHLVIDNSIDALMARYCISKQKILEESLDKKIDPELIALLK
jgi:SWI/SNF-related matrix-associated actin-dependent regulator 1 of chromatin subfamily A